MFHDVEAPSYPVHVAFDYPERMSRWKTLLRFFLILPLWIFLYLLANYVVLAIWAAILVRGRIPRWLFDFQVAYNRWLLRATGYGLLLSDGYPPFEGAYSIRYAVEYPDRLSRRRLMFWKLITSLPHLFVLFALWMTFIAVVPIGWVAILVSGRFPRGMHTYVAGVLRWGARVQAYVLSLTDVFPPFSLTEESGPAERRSYVVSSVLGVVATGGLLAGFVALAATDLGDHQVREVEYARLLRGDLSSEESQIKLPSATVALIGATDPADDEYSFIRPERGSRLVEFYLWIENPDDFFGLSLERECFTMTDTGGDETPGELLLINGQVAPLSLGARAFAEVQVVFALPVQRDPTRLRFEADCITASFFALESATYELR